MTHRFYVVDVFAERRYSGNPLAVIIGDAIGEESMQLLAAEMNFSEMTFVSPVPDADGAIAYGSSRPREIAFADHPILGTAAALRQHLGHDASKPLRLNLGVEQITVTFEPSPDAGEVHSFRAPPATIGPTCPRDDMAAALEYRHRTSTPRAPTVVPQARSPTVCTTGSHRPSTSLVCESSSSPMRSAR